LFHPVLDAKRIFGGATISRFERDGGVVVGAVGV
jgi:hypothetical protein